MRSQWSWFCLGVGVIGLFLTFPAYSNPLDSQKVAYLSSLEIHLEKLRQTYNASPETPELFIQLASVYLDVGDELYVETGKRIEAYQTGSEFAKKALALDSNQAQAHFLYAANLGHIAQLKGVLVSAFLIREIKGHVAQAIQLAPNHAPALHMMGMILDGLPWFLGGNAEEAVSFLERAVLADPNYTHARLNLGKIYLEEGRVEDAKEQFSLVTKTQSPRGAYAWAYRHNPEALSLLRQLEDQGRMKAEF